MDHVVGSLRVLVLRGSSNLEAEARSLSQHRRPLLPNLAQTPGFPVAAETNGKVGTILGLLLTVFSFLETHGIRVYSYPSRRIVFLADHT